MSYAVQQPRSTTNHSDKYRVFLYQDWINYVKGKRTIYAYQEFDAYQEARAYADAMNGINCQNR